MKAAASLNKVLAGSLVGLATLATALAFLGSSGPWSWAIVLGLWALVPAVVLRAPLTFVPAALLLLSPALRPLVHQPGAAGRLISLPEGGPPHWTSWLIEEQDGLVAGARLFTLLDPRIEPGLDQVFIEGLTPQQIAGEPTPAVPTWLGLQRPERFDARYYEAPDEHTALLFLHGFGGNYNRMCHPLHLALPELTLLCPSAGPMGDWASLDGQERAWSSLRWLQRQGYERVVLMGASNGAWGAAEMAPDLEADLAGLVLISGASSQARPADLPTLVFQGAHDEMMRPELALRYLDRCPGPSTWVEVDGGHYVLLTHQEELGEALREWLGGLP